MELHKVRNAVYESNVEGEMRVPVRVYAREEMLPLLQKDRTMWQAQNVATLPGIIKASFVMPDGHEGYGFPIGGVAAFDLKEGVISPGGVGYDINCGVRLIRTNLTEKDVKPKLQELIDTSFKNIPSGVGSKGRLRMDGKELEDAVTIGSPYVIEKGYGAKKDALHTEEGGSMTGADFSKVSDIAKKRGAPQFGTLGSGNHFYEIQKVEKIFPGAEEMAKAFGIFEGQITVMIHCGSRGFGHQVCSDYLQIMLNAAEKYGIKLADRELSSTLIDSPEARDYLGAMRCAVNYAFCNRQVLTHWTRESFEQVFKKDWEALGMDVVYDVCHNIAKFEKHEVDGKEREVCVHRKGATRAFWKGHKDVPADYRNIGQPVIIPGSMNTSSYLLCGLPGSAESWGTVCHGAGRVMSRHSAIREFQGTVEKELQEKGIIYKAQDRHLLAEEAGGAYKNVDLVVQSVEDAGLAKIVAKMIPLGVVKG